MKISQLTTPLNAKDLIGKPMLFARMPVARLSSGGEARISQNLMTGNFFVSGQKERVTPYIFSSLSHSICMMKTINHYNKTGEIVKFKEGKISELVLCDQ